MPSKTSRLSVGRALLLSVVGGLLLAGPPAARATENLNKELAALAKQIKELLDKEKQDAIAVGEFSGPAHLPGSGALIKKTLADELTRLGVTVKSEAKNFEVKGDYRDFLDPSTDNGQGDKFLGIKITARVFDANGDEVVNYRIPARVVHGNTDVVTVLGGTVDEGPQGDQFERNKKLQDSLRDRTTNPPHVDGTRISASPKSPYAIEVRVKAGKEYRPVQPEVKDGLAFVPLKKDDVYAVAVFNNSDQDAGVQLTIDGLSMFAFSELKDKKTGQPLFTHLVCPRGGSLVEGWHINNEKTDEFQITDYAKSAAAALQSKGEVGTITVTFAAAFPKGKRPADELLDRSADIATGRGATKDVKYQVVEREFGVLRAAVSVRYVK